VLAVHSGGKIACALVCEKTEKRVLLLVFVRVRLTYVGEPHDRYVWSCALRTLCLLTG
jgi:hypothetical protein